MCVWATESLGQATNTGILYLLKNRYSRYWCLTLTDSGAHAHVCEDIQDN